MGQVWKFYLQRKEGCAVNAVNLATTAKLARNTPFFGVSVIWVNTALLVWPLCLITLTNTFFLTTGTSKNVQLYHGIFYLSYRFICHFGTVSPTLKVSFTLCFFLYDFLYLWTLFISGLSPSLDSLLLWTFSLFDSSLICIIHHKTRPLQLHVPTTPLTNPTYNPHLDHN